MASNEKSNGKRQPGPKAPRRSLPGKSAVTAVGVLAAAAILNEANSATNLTELSTVHLAGIDNQKGNVEVDALEISEVQRFTGSFSPAAGEPFASAEVLAQRGRDVSSGETKSDPSGDSVRADSAGDGDPAVDADALAQSVEGESSNVGISPLDSAGDTTPSPLQLAQAVTAPAPVTADAAALPGSGTAGGAAAEVGAVSAAPIGIGPILGGLVAAVAVGSAVGGGGSAFGNGVAAGAKTTVSNGIVIDGPVKNATIFYDENNDGKLNGLEKSTVTNDDGSYTLTGYTQTTVGKFVVLPGGVDTFSGKAVGLLTGKEGADGSTVISPLTTLLANTNLTQAELMSALGITGLTVNLETFDPFAAMNSNDAAVRSLGEKVFTAGQQIMTVMQASIQQSGSTGGNASDPAAQYAALNSVALAITVAIHTVDNLSANEIAGGGLMKTIATFAIASGNGIDVASFENNANALTEINAALAGNTTAQTILGAVVSINQSIATAYVDISSKIAAGGAALADAAAITALSQTVLGTSINTLITTGVSSGLKVLSSSTGLAALVDTVSAQIEAGGVGNTAALPQILTVAFSDAIAHIGTPYADADMVSVKVADSDLASLVTHAGDFHDIHVDLLDVLDSSLPLTETQAETLIAAGLSFVDDNAITVSAEGTHLSTSLKDLQKLGVDNVLIDGVASAGAGHDITLSLGAGTLAADAITDFAPAADVVLNIADTQVTEVAGLASKLYTAGIDFIGADDGTLTLTDSDLHTILSSGLTFANDAVVSAQVSDAGLTTLVADLNAAALLGVNEGVDFINMADGTAVLTETQASSLIAAGIEFSASDTVAVQAEGTHLSTSLKDLQKLGVDNVLIDGVASAGAGHDITLSLGAGTLAADAITDFAPAADVVLNIADTQVTEVAGLASKLYTAGIDFIGADDGTLTLTDSDLHTILSSGLTFANDAVVSAQVSDAGLTTLVADLNAAALLGVNEGVDFINMADGTAVLTETQASSLIAAGIEFSASDTVAVQAEGTHLSTSLKDLQKLGVDNVLIDSAAATTEQGHDLSLVLGSGALSEVGIPHFAAGADVVLGIAEGQVTEVATYAAPLHDAGIDYIGGIDGLLTVGGADLHSIFDSGLVFASETVVTAAVSDDFLTTLIQDLDAAALQDTNLGVDTVDMIDNKAWITEAQAVSLIHAGVDFAAADSVDMQADGTHVATSLKDLHDLGVDHVTVDAVAATANPGHDLVLALGDVATGANPAAELLAFLETYAGHSLFTNSADVALELSSTVFAALDTASNAVRDAIVTDLVNLGVDEVKVIGTDTEHDLHAI